MTNHLSASGRSGEGTLYRRRIAHSTTVFGTTLRLSGFVLLIVQIVKAIISVSNGDRMSLSAFFATLLAIALIVVGRPPFIKTAIDKFAVKMRRNSLVIYAVPWLLTALVVWAKIQVGPTSARWAYMSSEGSVSEYGTAIAYLIVPSFAYPIAKQFWRQRQKLMASLYWLLTAGSVFIGMEEISWGQRLIGFEEPRFWAENNVQSEFTFHNLAFFQDNYLHLSFLIAGFLGSFCWIALRYWQANCRKRQAASQQEMPRRLDFNYILPDWSLSSFFYPTFLFYYAIDYTDFSTQVDFLHFKDQEHCEFIMSLGVLLFVVISFYRQGREADLQIRDPS